MPASLPMLSNESTLPRSAEKRIEYLEEERNERPRQLIYRFYAGGGFWLCRNEAIARFLRSFSNSSLIEMVPFIRTVLNVCDLLSY
jgi:hypothetical protein